MRYIVLILLMAAIALNAQVEYKTTYWSDYGKDTVVKTPYINKKKNGLQVAMHTATNQIVSKLNYKDDKKHGKQTWYHDNGNLKVTAPYLNGKVNGVQKSYTYKSGSLHTATNFKNGIRVGSEKEYYENGKLKSECTYKNGIQVGIKKGYYESGKLLLEQTFKDNKVVSLKVYYEDGNIKEETGYINNKIDGIQKYFHSNGKIQAKSYYKMGTLNKMETFDKNGLQTAKKIIKNGKIEKIIEYVNGKPLVNNNVLYSIREGGTITQTRGKATEKTFYDENGQVVAVYNYYRGKLNTCREYEDGQEKEKYSINNGIIVGHTYKKRYDDSMVKNHIIDITYPNGDLVSIIKALDRKSGKMITSQIRIFNNKNQELASYTYADNGKLSDISVLNIESNSLQDGYRIKNNILIEHRSNMKEIKNGYLNSVKILDEKTGKMSTVFEEKINRKGKTFSVIRHFQENPSVLEYTFSGTFQNDGETYLRRIKDAYYISGQKRFHEEKDVLNNKTTKQEWDEKGTLL